MESFDQSLKYLLQHEPADFIRFGLGDATIELTGPIPSDLPSRGRDVDGGYRIVRRGEPAVAHLEFHRRHQNSEELAVDVAEAQIRLYRRERVQVVSLVWDLYGKRDEALLEERTLVYGATAMSAGSSSVHVRVNLRALRADELLSNAPPALWPLVALTSDGADDEGVRRARDAIEARTDLSPAERADHLAVLWFVAEAEDVPVRAMKVYITKEKLMESSLYKSIFQEGEARGRAEGRAETLSGILVRSLTHRLGVLDAAVRQRIRAFSDAETLEAWCDEVFLAADSDAAQRLVDKISRALPA